MKKVADITAEEMRLYTDDLQKKLIEGSLSFLDLKKAVEPLFDQANNPFPSRTPYLRLVGETIISATKAGKGIKRDNPKPFGRIDDDFDEENYQTESKDTEEAKAYVYQQISEASYAYAFKSINKDLDLLRFETHEQIKDFVENSPELLHPEGKETYFLFKSKSGQYLVAVVNYAHNSWRVDVKSFLSRNNYWIPSSMFRFVVLSKKP